MIYNKHNFSIHNMDDRRTIIRGIRVTKDFTEITNGHYAVRVYTPFQDCIESTVKDLPDVGEHLNVATDFESCVIALRVAKEVEKAIPAKATFAPILENAWITQRTDAKHIEFCTSDLDITKPIRAKVEDIRYPDIDAIIPTKKEPEYVTAFSAEYMMKICQQFKRMGINCVDIDFFGKESAIKMSGKTAEGQKLLVVLMPMKRE